MKNEQEELFFNCSNRDIIEISRKSKPYYYFSNNNWKIKDSCIASFFKEHQLGSWSKEPKANTRWLNYSDYAIYRFFKGKLELFCLKFQLCTDKKQISHVIYFFVQCFIKTLARKYQTSMKQIFIRKIIEKNGYLLLLNEKDNKYHPIFVKKEFYRFFVI